MVLNGLVITPPKSAVSNEYHHHQIRCTSVDNLADDDDVWYYIGERLKLEGEMEKMGV